MKRMAALAGGSPSRLDEGTATLELLAAKYKGITVRGR